MEYGCPFLGSKERRNFVRWKYYITENRILQVIFSLASIEPPDICRNEMSDLRVSNMILSLFCSIFHNFFREFRKISSSRIFF